MTNNLHTVRAAVNCAVKLADLIDRIDHAAIDGVVRDSLGEIIYALEVVQADEESSR